MKFHRRVTVSAPDKSASAITPTACGNLIPLVAWQEKERPSARKAGGFFMDNEFNMEKNEYRFASDIT